MNANLDTQTLKAKVSELMPLALADLKELVSIPSIAFAGYDQSHVQKSAELVAQKFAELGLLEVQIDSVAKGAPAVLATRAAKAGKPTVMLYAHHDVQPIGDEKLWTTPAFEPTIRNGRLYGRGTADDKAGVVVHLTALRALKSFIESEGLGLVVFIEGEEEFGSESFRPFIEKHREKMQSDVIVVADSANWAIGEPALTTSLRGVVSAHVEVEVLKHSLHSGLFGGPVIDALTMLAKLLATLHDENGEVAVKGLHNDNSPNIEMSEETFRTDAGVLEGVELSGTGSITARLWTKPAISVIGIDAPSVKEASNTLLHQARAKVSMRIAPGQDPNEAAQLLESHLLEHAPKGAKVKVEIVDLGKPFKASVSPASKLAFTAFEQAFGVTPVEIGLGGSIPFISDLLEVFPQAEVLVTGVEDPDSRAHGIDESLHLADFEKVCSAHTLLLNSIAREVDKL